MSDTVIFYALSQKFLEREEDVPAEAKQVVYYSLAIGHHIGVIDCLKTVIECPFEGYQTWIGHLPEGEARRKMEGIAKFGEITIDASHTHLLAAAFDKIIPELDPAAAEWSRQLIQALKQINEEPALYLMVRRR